MEKPARFIGTTLIALNILIVIYALLWSNVLDSVWKFWRIENPFCKLAIETIISTYCFYFLNLFLKHSFSAKE